MGSSLWLATASFAALAISGVAACTGNRPAREGDDRATTIRTTVQATRAGMSRQKTPTGALIIDVTEADGTRVRFTWPAAAFPQASSRRVGEDECWIGLRSRISMGDETLMAPGPSIRMALSECMMALTLEPPVATPLPDADSYRVTIETVGLRQPGGSGLGATVTFRQKTGDGAQAEADVDACEAEAVSRGEVDTQRRTFDVWEGQVASIAPMVQRFKQCLITRGNTVAKE